MNENLNLKKLLALCWLVVTYSLVVTSEKKEQSPSILLENQ